MSWVQVKSPNLNVQTYMGWCLTYVQDAFGLNWTGSYALDGWSRNKLNHEDRNIPSEVYVPIWFDGYWDGERYGHVAIYKDGVVYSSPWSEDSAAYKRHDTITSIAETERIYGMRYIGWSEDMNGQIVITKEDGMNSNHVMTLFQFMRGVDPNKDELKYWTGRQAEELIDVLRAQPSARDTVKNMEVGRVARKDNWQGQINTLNKENKELKKLLKDKGSVLKPGSYIVN